jgi:hypothetical protein
LKIDDDLFKVAIGTQLLASRIVGAARERGAEVVVFKNSNAVER